MLSAGVAELPDIVKVAAMRAVREFDDFAVDKDPHLEHDFGAFEHCQRTFLWKIDLYEDPDVKDADGEVVVQTDCGA